MSSDGNHMTWLGGVKQKYKAGLESSVNEIKCSIDSKFNDINDQLKDIKESFTKSIHDIVKNLTLTLWPLFMDGVQLSQSYSHYEETVYFLPLLSK